MMLDNQTCPPGRRNNFRPSKAFTVCMIHKLCGNTISCELPHNSGQCRTTTLSDQHGRLSPSVDPKAPVIQDMVWSQHKVYLPQLYAMGNETKVGLSHYFSLVPPAFIFIVYLFGVCGLHNMS